MSAGTSVGGLSIEESALLIGPVGAELVGVLARPAQIELAKPVGVVIVVGGPQTRVGAHRQFVTLARALAAAGYPCLRFDYTGMGDSAGAMPDFEAAGPDIARACEALRAELPACRKIVLWGLCDGATAAILHAAANPDIAAVIAANPWARSEATRAQTVVKAHYSSRLRSAEFWKKLASGRVNVLASAREAVGYLVQAKRPVGAKGSEDRSLPARLSQALGRLDGRVHLQLSGRDLVASEFEIAMIRRPAIAAARESMFRLETADHTFSNQLHWRVCIDDVLACIENISQTR